MRAAHPRRPPFVPERKRPTARTADSDGRWKGYDTNHDTNFALRRGLGQGVGVFPAPPLCNFQPLATFFDFFAGGGEGKPASARSPRNDVSRSESRRETSET